MELVGAHHAVNLIAPPRVIELRQARPEAGDLEQQLGAVALQKLDIVGDLKVLPDVIGDGAAHVALQVGMVRHPALRARIQVQVLGFLLAIAATLPGKHRAVEPRAARRLARRAEAPIAIQQQRPGDFRHPIVQKGKDKQLIPEDMALVGLPGPAARRHADIQANGVGRDRLQQVHHVQPQQHRDIQRERRPGGLEVHVEVAPEILPGHAMLRQHRLEAPRPRQAWYAARPHSAMAGSRDV